METTTTTGKPVKSFKDVHADLERESMLLRSRDIQAEQFMAKADFLSRIGFTESIATKLYGSVANSINVVEDYMHRYGHQSKFILPPQLERICEKYDLYVREPVFFMGDIPVKNIQDMMNFKVYLCDIILHPTRNKWGIVDMVYEYFNDDLSAICNLYGVEPPEYSWSIHDDKFTRIIEKWLDTEEGKKKYVTLPQLYKHCGENISIAAVKGLFNEQAFSQTKARIPHNFSELNAKAQVDLDPIVLCRVKQGYLVVTAWGDEANDELVANEKFN